MFSIFFGDFVIRVFFFFEFVFSRSFAVVLLFFVLKLYCFHFTAASFSLHFVLSWASSWLAASCSNSTSLRPN
ncbi:hypothetical protein BDW71DRAFT_131709 [Aspergillus fruticulosus]